MPNLNASENVSVRTLDLLGSDAEYLDPAWDMVKQVKGIHRVDYEECLPGNITLGAIDEATLSGVALLSVMRNVFVIALAVHPDKQRNGIGSLLLRNVEAYATGQNIFEVALEPAASDSVLKFYERNGYAWTRETRPWADPYEMIKVLQ